MRAVQSRPTVGHSEQYFHKTASCWKKINTIHLFTAFAQVHQSSKAHSTLPWIGCQGLIIYYAPGSVSNNVDSALIVFEDIFLIAVFVLSL